MKTREFISFTLEDSSFEPYTAQSIAYKISYSS